MPFRCGANWKASAPARSSPSKAACAITMRVAPCAGCSTKPTRSLPKPKARIIEEVLARFEIAQVLCVHRVGELALSELAVWVGVSAAHRDAAFAACRYVIDEIKTRVPIWKHERYADGEAEWLHPADH